MCQENLPLIFIALAKLPNGNTQYHLVLLYYPVFILFKSGYHMAVWPNLKGEPNRSTHTQVSSYPNLGTKLAKYLACIATWFWWLFTGQLIPKSACAQANLHPACIITWFWSLFFKGLSQTPSGRKKRTNKLKTVRPKTKVKIDVGCSINTSLLKLVGRWFLTWPI